MRSWHWIILIVIVLLVAAWVLNQNIGTLTNTEKVSASSQTSAQLLMKTDVLEPETLTIKKGTTVEFKNMDSQARWPASNLHPTHGIYPEFDPLKPIEPGKVWEFTFNKEGSWKYHDHLLPSIRGIIVVN